MAEQEQEQEHYLVAACDLEVQAVVEGRLKLVLVVVVVHLLSFAAFERLVDAAQKVVVRRKLGEVAS